MRCALSLLWGALLVACFVGWRLPRTLFVVVPSGNVREVRIKQSVIPAARLPPSARPAQCSHLDDDLCSLGDELIAPFIGCVDDVSAFREMLRARAHEDEVILLMATASHLAWPLNAILNLREKGYGHYVLLMLREEGCQAARAVEPGVGCIWSDFMSEAPPSPLWHDVRRLWMLRWMIVARFLQHGVNVLMMDSDNATPSRLGVYHVLKSPHLRRFNAIVPYEPNLPGANAGAIYLQAAHPAGPLAWAAAQVATRTVRWLADPLWLLSRVPGADLDLLDSHSLFEQDVFNDLLCSLFAGRLVYHNTLSPHPVTWPVLSEEWREAHTPLCGWLNATVALPDAWPLGMPSGRLVDTEVEWHPLEVPSVPAVRPPGTDGPAFPPGSGGTWMPQLRAWLAAAGPTFPPEDEPRPESTTTPQEAILRSPPWLLARWPESGVDGNWDSERTGGAPRCVLCHAIVMQGPGNQGKLAVFKAFGWWRLSEQQQAAATHIDGEAPPLLGSKVIAFAPELNFVTKNVDAALHLTHHLVRMAVLSGRRPVWPALHPASPWLRRAGRGGPWDPQVHPSPIRDHRCVVYGGEAHMTVITFFLMSGGCHREGMSYLDFQEMLASLPDEDVTRSAANTVLHRRLGTAVAAEFKPHTILRQQVKALQPGLEYSKGVTMSAAKFEALAESMAAAPVLYVATPILVKDFAGHAEHLENLLAFRAACNPHHGLFDENPLIEDRKWTSAKRWANG